MDGNMNEFPEITGLDNPMLPCDICGKLMQEEGKSPSEVRFSCNCKQHWIFHSDGRTHCVVLRTLWPTDMKEDSPMFRNEYIPEWLFKRRFYAKSKFLCGFWDKDKTLLEMKEAQSTFDKWFIDHPLPKRKWWEVWNK